MESIFIEVNGTKKEFDDFCKELDELNWQYDISGHDYWSKTEEGDSWYIWSDLYLHGEEGEALEFIEPYMEKYNMKEYTAEMYHAYLTRNE